MIGGRALRTALLTIALGALTTLGACAPDFRPMGPAIGPAHLTDDAIITADGARLPLHVWPATGETRAVILALHGFTDYSNAFALPASAWSTVGITTYAYDQRGFGAAEPHLRWAGAETYTNDARTALSVIRRAHPDVPLYLLGESMGGAVAILAVTETETAGDIADGMILIAPGMLDRPELSEAERTFLDIGAHTLPWAMSGKRGITVWPTDNLALLKQMAQDPLMQREVRFDQIYGLLNMLEKSTRRIRRIDLPTLALFGGKDEILPPGAADYFEQQTIAQMARGTVRTERIPGAYHMLLRDKDATSRHDRIGAWVFDLPPVKHNATIGKDMDADATNADTEQMALHQD